MKKTVCFIIVYIGELKYYERLFSRIEDEFNIHLVFIRPDDERRRKVVAYAKENGYTFTIIDYNLGGAGKKSRNIPFLSHLVKYYKHIIQCREFLIDNHITRLVGPKPSLPIRAMFREANYLHIRTMAVQRGHLPPRNRYGITPEKLSFHKHLYARTLEMLQSFVNLVFRGPRYAFTQVNPQKVGALGKEGKTVLPERFGYDPESITHLGSVEYQQITELMEKLESDSKFKNSLIAKYNYSTKKKNILIVSARWHHYIDARISYTKEEEADLIAYFDNIIRIIREVFPERDADIHFKLHPAEDNIYESYEKYGVRIHENEAKIDEMVCISDLYVSYPVTSANYMALAGNIPSLFINFSPLQVLNLSAPDFGITHVITDKNEFRKDLNDYKNGKLKSQFDQSSVIRDSIDRTIEFIKHV